MAHQRSLSLASFGSVLSFKTRDFTEIFDNVTIDTDLFVKDIIKNVINHKEEELRGADSQWNLHAFLHGLLENAPTADGRRYVAVVLHIAHLAEKSGEDAEAVIGVARAWKEYLFRPSSFLQWLPSLYLNSFLSLVQTLARNFQHFPSDCQTPTLDNTAAEILSATRGGQQHLRDLVISIQ
jgi:hypothetical protein